MTLHCGGRLGILSWLYEQRQVITFELGLIDKQPIAECGSAYLDDGLVIIQQDDNSTAKPSATFNAKEINLFSPVSFVTVSREFSFIERQYFEFVSHYQSSSYDSIDHPPSLA
jgi:hypothetical protein